MSINAMIDRSQEQIKQLSIINSIGWCCVLIHKLKNSGFDNSQTFESTFYSSLALIFSGKSNVMNLMKYTYMYYDGEQSTLGSEMWKVN